MPILVVELNSTYQSPYHKPVFSKEWAASPACQRFSRDHKLRYKRSVLHQQYLVSLATTLSRCRKGSPYHDMLASQCHAHARHRCVSDQIESRVKRSRVAQYGGSARHGLVFVDNVLCSIKVPNVEFSINGYCQQSRTFCIFKRRTNINKKALFFCIYASYLDHENPCK